LDRLLHNCFSEDDGWFDDARERGIELVGHLREDDWDKLKGEWKTRPAGWQYGVAAVPRDLTEVAMPMARNLLFDMILNGSDAVGHYSLYALRSIPDSALCISPPEGLRSRLQHLGAYSIPDAQEVATILKRLDL
jgi:hypothetical protein